MLKIYDKDHKPAGYIKAYKDLKIESVVSTGDKTLSFTYMGRKSIEPEFYIQTQKDEYVVKEKSQNMDGFPQYVAVLNLEELEARPWGSFSVKETTVDEAAKLALAGTGWTVGECNVKKKRNAGMLQVSSRDIVEKLATAFLCEIVYDSKNKTVSFYNETGEDKGAYFIKGLNLKKLSTKSDSYDFYTQIIPIGENNLTIESVNDGKNYLENYQYSTKKKAYIWKEESYTDAQALKEDAELKLQDLSRPAESYSVTVADLAKQKKQYSILEYHIGDKIWLIDSTTRTRVKQRIVKMTEYPQSPEKNTCEIANTVLTFEELQQKYKEAAEIVNTVVNGDGRYTGVINVSDILNFEKGLSDSDIISGINDTIDSLNGNLKDLKYTVGTINANYLTAEEADLKYASMEKFNAVSGNVEDLTAKYAEVENLKGTFADFKNTTTDKLSAQDASIEKIQSEKISAKEADLKYASMEKFNAVSGNVEDLTVKYAEVENLKGTFADFKNTTTDKLSAQDASIEKLQSEKISAKDIEGKFANIDFSNIGKAAIKQFFSESGMIKDLVVGDQTITGELVGVTISGDLLKGNTVVADKLVIKGSDGLYYKLNTDGMTVEKEQTDYNSLNGQVIRAKSITATKIDVDDLVAFGATIGGFHISQNGIHSGVKETVDNNTRGIYMDTDGQIAFGDASNYVKFYRTSEGKYKLAIALDELYIGSSGTNVETAISEAKSAADNATSKAGEAASVANTAKSTAESAASAASTAKSTAESASKTASSATETANSLF